MGMFDVQIDGAPSDRCCRSSPCPWLPTKMRPSCFLRWWIEAKWFASSFASWSFDKQSIHCWFWLMHIFGKSYLTRTVGDRSCQVTITLSMNVSNSLESDPWEMAKIPKRMQSLIDVLIVALNGFWGMTSSNGGWTTNEVLRLSSLSRAFQLRERRICEPVLTSFNGKG